MKDYRILSIEAILPKVGRKSLDFGPGEDGRSKATILIGQNGSGKSTLLRDIVLVLEAFDRGGWRNRPRTQRVLKMVVRADEYTTEIAIPTERQEFRSYAASQDFSSVCPSRIIALSFTPFDKFPVSSLAANKQDDQKLFYCYLGFKSETGGNSPRSRLFNSIDQLVFAKSTPQSDRRIEETLAAIGYRPMLKLAYRLPMTVERELRGRTSSFISEERRSLAEQYKLANFVDETRSRSATLTYTLDLANGRFDENSPIPYEGLRELVRARLLQVSSVQLFPFDRFDPVELLELSSGELNILSGFLGLAAYLEDGCLILIDEPENSLHPEWQLRYVDMLEAVLKRHQGCHYIIATHSPLIASGVADAQATLLRLDQSPVSLIGALVADASPDATLVNAFRVVTPANSYLRQIVLEALGLIQTGKAQSKRAHDLADFLASLYDRVPEDDKLRDLIPSLVDSIKSASTEQ